MIGPVPASDLQYAVPMGDLGVEDSAAITPITPIRPGLTVQLEDSAGSRAWPRVLARPDVALRDGELVLVGGEITPQQGMIEDLLFVRRVLADAGIQFLLVRGNDETPVLAVDRRNRKAVGLALAEASSSEPFYARARPGGPAIFVADGKLAVNRKQSVFRLYRPRLDRTGRVRYGAGSGVQLEFWRFGAKRIIVPAQNALTRRIVPRAEFTESEVERYGVNWRTIAEMSRPVAADVLFDIDMVFSWVDGTDVEFQRARARRMKSYVVGDGDDHAARFRQIDELRYALRSVYAFAPWVRRIFVVSDSARPAWLADHPMVTVVRSEEIFADPLVLPTHNSHAIETQLHRIPGLSEHFLYSNDDMFFGRPVRPSMFFSPGGVTRFVEADTRIGLGPASEDRSGFENAARVNRALLERKFGVTITRHLEHCAVPLRKTVLAELELEFRADFDRTAASRFRSSTDVSVTNSLYHYFALLTGRAVTQTDARVKYVDTTTRSGLKAMQAILKRRSFDMFCLNDGSYPELTAEERAEAVGTFLESYFTIAAPWEQVPEAVGEQVG